MDTKTLTAELLKNSRFEFNPEPMYVYKPRPDGNGAALKVNLRLNATLGESGEFVQTVDGGLFVDLAKQTSKGGGGAFPTFGWQDASSLVKAKLCLPDILGILAALRNVRRYGKPVPTALQPKNEMDAAKRKTTLSLFHKFGATTSAITLTFGADSSVFGVSKSATLRRSLVLTCTEELMFERYLEIALEGFLRMGVR